MLTYIQSHVLFSIVGAFILTVLALKGIPELQNDYLTALPPFFTVSLAVCTAAVPFVSYLRVLLRDFFRSGMRRLRVPWHAEEELPFYNRNGV